MMKFKIKKEVSPLGTWFWTEPIGFFARLKYVWNPLSELIDSNPCNCWSTKDEAEQHIKRWNSGYYKKKYYEKYVQLMVGEQTMQGVIHTIDLEQDDLKLLQEKGTLYHDTDKGMIEIRLNAIKGIKEE